MIHYAMDNVCNLCHKQKRYVNFINLSLVKAA